MSETLIPLPVKFTQEEAHAAYDAWQFNCGPGALCAVTGARPDDARRVLPQFDQRGYTNPKMMRAGLNGLKKPFHELLAEEGAVNLPQGTQNFPAFGLVRIQWAGRWTKPGVPVPARWRHTHWVASCGEQVFDINCMCAGGWVPVKEWTDRVVPWLLNEIGEKSFTGEWWATHCWEVQRG